MQVKKAVTDIKAAGHDISDEYSVEECLGFLNTAINEVSSLLIAARSPMMAAEILLHDGESVPERYVSPAGRYPIRMTGRKVQFIDRSLSEIRFRYWQTMPLLESDAGEMPFPHEALNDYAVKVAILLALNRNEYDISQDKALYDELRGLIAGAVSLDG